MKAKFFAARWKSVQDRLVALTRYRAGWDGYHAAPIDSTTAIFSLEVISPMIRGGLPEPFIAPLAYGGLQYEWHGGGTILELEVRGPYDVFAYFEPDPNSEPEEKVLRGVDMKELAEIFTRARLKFDASSQANKA